MAGARRSCRYTRYATVALCIFQGYLLAVSFQHPESYHTLLPGITDTIRKLGIPLVDDLGWTFRIVTVISLTAGTLFLMWLGDQITERGIGNGISLDHHGRHRRAPAGGAGAGMEDFCAITDRRKPGESGDSRLDDGVPVYGDRSGHRDDARRAKITVQYAKRVVGRKDVRRPDPVHAVESELRGRDADHFCLGIAAVSHDDRRHCCSRTVRLRERIADAMLSRLAALCRYSRR